LAEPAACWVFRFPHVELQMPKGISIALTVNVTSHSWREMAAVSCYRAGHDFMRMTDRGFWRDPNTMMTSYIRPFLAFPFSPMLAQLYDDLA
jgi:hypothetical protein